MVSAIGVRIGVGIEIGRPELTWAPPKQPAAMHAGLGKLATEGRQRFSTEVAMEQDEELSIVSPEFFVSNIGAT